MKTTVLLVLSLVWSASLQAQQCRLKNPVPLKMDEMGRMDLVKVKVDQLPRADFYDKINYRNGELHLRFAPISIGSRPTGHYGAAITNGHGMGFGFSETYLGPFSISGSESQSGGEQLFTTRIHDGDGTGVRELEMTLSHGNITSLKFTVPYVVEDPKGSGFYRRMDGILDWVCVLEMTPTN